jgi:hypothetical protein
MQDLKKRFDPALRAVRREKVRKGERKGGKKENLSGVPALFPYFVSQKGFMKLLWFSKPIPAQIRERIVHIGNDTG